MAPPPRDEPTARELEVDRIFREALDRDTADRSAFLLAACGEDRELRLEVEALLQGCEEEDPRLEPGGGLLLLAEDANRQELMPGARVGAWQLEREIGRGGMGRVFEAERIDGHFRQRVALKLVRWTGDSESFARLERERQILASLEHPRIARLVDGGIAEDGSPFLAMEYVEGVALTAYCDERRLSLRDRLGLFLAVCEAVEAAHRALVVHRDIKPSNVLVDTAGQVKLIDFGIARLLEPTLAHAQIATGLLTPEYASPEQFQGQPITVASDVYQLGIVLYELLTGRRPHSLSELAPARWQHAICERQPRLPSAVAREGGEDALSARGLTKRGRWASALAGDLDNIALKALHKRPEHRYGSVDRLREDVERHLAGLPVAARPGKLGYRVGRFLGRNAASVSALLGALVVLVGLALFYTHRLAEERDLARRASQRAEAERTRATLSGEEAREVADFLVGLFEVSDPERALGETVTARELLDRGASRIDAELRDQPLTRARLMETMGTIYEKLGLFEPAGELLEGAVAIQDGLEGAADLQLVSSLSKLAAVYWRQARYEDAERLLQRALILARGQPGPESAEVADVLARLGNVHLVRNELAAAEGLYRQSLAMKERLLGADHPELAGVLNNLGIVEDYRGRAGEAEALHGRALAIRERAHGPDHPRVAMSLINLARLRRHQGDFDGAERLADRAFEIQLRVYGPESSSVGEVHRLRGLVHRDRGELDAAERELRRAMAIWVQAVGEEHPQVGSSGLELASVLRDRGALEEAERLAQRAALVLAANPAGSPSDRARARLLWVDLLLRRRAIAEAARAFAPLPEALHQAPEFAQEFRLEAVALARRLGDSGLVTEAQLLERVLAQPGPR